jgi:hypothetical protein
MSQQGASKPSLALYMQLSCFAVRIRTPLPSARQIIA